MLNVNGALVAILPKILLYKVTVNPIHSQIEQFILNDLSPAGGHFDYQWNAENPASALSYVCVQDDGQSIISDW